MPLAASCAIVCRSFPAASCGRKKERNYGRAAGVEPARLPKTCKSCAQMSKGGYPTGQPPFEEDCISIPPGVLPANVPGAFSIA